MTTSGFITSAKYAIKQYTSFCISTPLLLGTACLPIVPKLYAKKLLHLWTDIMLKSIGTAVNVQNHAEEATSGTTGTLYVHLNQQTHLASLLYTLGINTDFNFVVNIEYAIFPFLGWLQARLGAVTIIRQYPPQAKRALKTAVERIKRGENIGISIEGRRSEDGNLCPYKKGAAVMAIEAQCDIIPVMTFGEYILWPTGTWVVQPGGKIDVKLYPRMSTAGLTYADRDELTKKLRALAETEIASWEAKNEEYIQCMSNARRDRWTW